jgi:tetratricopeptide (TPR) repeat protein
MRSGIILVLLFTIFNMNAQSNKSEAIAIEKQIVKMAKNYGDPNVATSSMYKLIALEGANSTYKDSLAYVYFSARRYAPCFMMASEVLERDPNHKEMLELKAISLESLGAYDKAAEAYKQLFAKTNNNYHGYNLAKLQFSTKKYEESLKTIQKIEKLNDTGKYKVTFSINQNHNQQVELLAAIYYLKGLVDVQLVKKADAKISFEKALKIQSDFVLAKDQLDDLNK